MDISKLVPYIGQNIKDYKVLCSILGEKVKNGGTSKTSQLADWERYFKYEREGDKYKIIQIYDKPLPKQDNRIKGNNSKYVQLIEPILISYLINKGTKSDTLSKKKWFITLGMANESYDDEKYEAWLLKNFTNSYVYYKFIQYADRKMKDTFFNALNNIKKRNLINWEEQIIVVPFNGEGFIAKKSEKKLILKIEGLVMKEMECNTKWDIYRKGLSNRYYKRCDELVQKKCNWSYYYRQFFVELIDHDTIEIMTNNEIECLRLKLNNEIINSIINAIRADISNQFKKHSTWVEKYNEENLWDTFLKYMIDTGEEVMKIENEPFKYMDNFIDMQIELAEKLLRVG